MSTERCQRLPPSPISTNSHCALKHFSLHPNLTKTPPLIINNPNTFPNPPCQRRARLDAFFSAWRALCYILKHDEICYTYQKFANRLNGKVSKNEKPKTCLDGTVVIFDEAHNLTAEKRRDTAVKVKLCRDELLEHLTDVDELKYDREE